MNVLIFTGRFGMGHYSAAEAIYQKIKKENASANIKIIDFVDYVCPKTNNIIYNTFNFFVTKCAYIYNFFSKIDEKNNTILFKKNIIKKIQELLKLNKADLIISTFPLCSQYLSAYKSYYRDYIPLYTYITDIFVHEEWVAPRTNLYFVGCKNTKNVLISRGVNKNKIVVSGIPVRQEFLEEKTITKNRKKNVLIMGGGLGLMPSGFDFLNKLIDKNIHVTIITGKNEILKEKLELEYPTVEVLGYVDNVSDYMRKANLLITKSGGVTTFEAIHCETPLYIIKPFLVQEIGNAEYIAQSNIGRVVWSKKNDIANDILNLLDNNSLLEIMKQNMHTLINELDSSCSNVYLKKEQS